MPNTIIQEKSSTKSTHVARLKALPWRRIGMFFCISTALYLFLAIFSHFSTGQSDHSLIDALLGAEDIHPLPEADNWMGRYGALVSHFLVFKWLGIGALLLPMCMGLFCYNLYRRQKRLDLRPILLPALLTMLWVEVLFGYFSLIHPNNMLLQALCGGMGYELAHIVYKSTRSWGIGAVLLLLIAVQVRFFFNISLKDIFALFRRRKMKNPTTSHRSRQAIKAKKANFATKKVNFQGLNKNTASLPKPPQNKPIDTVTAPKNDLMPSFELEVSSASAQEKNPPPPPQNASVNSKQDIGFEVETTAAQHKIASKQEAAPVASASPGTSSYRLPPLSLLSSKESGKIRVNKEELDQNKDTIIETLTNFRIEIANIKATIGPTVTLYEIVPAPGVRISKIKNLEDDIALSLSALGIRIIAPIPGKGTIGIEVPNKKREMIPLRAAFSHPSFASCTHDLPIVLGKNITGNIEIVDLARMPHILMAGATGQGKSVGLNVMLSSLLYKKKPETLKLVLVDPKKVELSLFSCIERHFLAKLPDGEEAIITDTQQVVHTLTALCKEMDNRYELLKVAGCRNLKEYNIKQESQQNNAQLPYIVLVIDELADLMMTAGKEVETPIARLAQLARAIGIHLIVATQRPSVNVITGIIKANFPARISYRVSSQVDSRTILDARGAEQLIGMGDMLFSAGNEHIRLQCPYVDTKEVEDMCHFIDSQPKSAPPYLLPEVEKDAGTQATALAQSERDVLFEDAAQLIVQQQQGSTSLIQRKMKLGFNRAGRIMDQMESAGIVGPAIGSKPREVLIQDLASLHSILNQ